MNNLLPDASVYRKVTKGEGMMEAAKFKKARGMILQLARGKGLLHLLEFANIGRSKHKIRDEAKSMFRSQCHNTLISSRNFYYQRLLEMAMATCWRW